MRRWHAASRPALAAAALAIGGALSAQETVVLRADGPPVWGASPTLVEEVRIGTLEGDIDYAFGSVGGVAVLDDGTIWVGDRHLSAIRRYTADGAYIDQIGREGEGPGEFRYPSAIRRLPDGSVAVWDDGQIRVSRFDTAGTFLDSFTPRTNMIGSAVFEEFEVDRDGYLYLVASNIREWAADRSVTRRMWWLVMRPDGEVLDSVFIRPGDSDNTMDPTQTFTVLSPLGYVVTARNDRYALDLHVSEARTVRIERPWEPVAYQRRERAEKRRLAEIFRSRNGRTELRVPEHKPAFSSFRVDEEGRLWVRMYAPGYVEPVTEDELAAREDGCAFFGLSRAECAEGATEWREPVVYEVVEPDGRYLGRVRFPNRETELMVMRGDRVWVVEEGTYEEEYVVRYRIEGGG